MNVAYSHPPSEQDRRGPFRPGALASGRHRFEAKVALRLVGGLQTACIVVLGVVFFALSHPDTWLLAPVADVLPLAVASPILACCTSLTTARGHRPVARIGAGACLASLLLAVLLVLLPINPPVRQGICLWFAACVGLVSTTHILWRRHVVHLRKTGRLTPNIVIVGATPNASRLIARAAKTGEVAVVGVFDDRLGRAPAKINGVPVLGDTDALLAHRIMPYVDCIVIAVPTHAQHRVRELLQRL